MSSLERGCAPHAARTTSSVLVAVLLTAVSMCGAALAQDLGTAVERIEITGSNIKRAEAETAENVQVITAEQIQRSGQPTVADYLRTVSANFASFNETFTNSFAPGAGGIALRGLSQKNTLVLLNGRRIANFGFAQNLEDTFVDLNVLPLSAIDRIEILKSGAAAIYGSDATAGVVNVILKQNSTERGIEAGGSLTKDGGGATRDASLSLGFGNFASDNYNIFVTGSAFKRDELLESQRAYTQTQDFRNRPDGTLGWVQSNSYTNNLDPTVPQAAFPTCGTNGLPGQVVNLSNFPTSATGTTCAYNGASQISLIPGSERANLTTTANLKLTPSWTAFGDVFFSTVKTTTHQTPAALGSSSVAYDPASGGVAIVPNTLPVGNPSNPNATPTDINYVFQSVGGQDYEVISNTYRVSAGARGSWLNWDWEGAYGHSQNDVVQTVFNAINIRNLASAIQNGTYNFLSPNQTPAGSAALRADFASESVSKLDTLGLKGSGGLYDLPAGTLSGAIGTEFRHESIRNRPDSQSLNGDILGYGIVQVDGGRSVYAGFGELVVPILKSLEADLAAREEHYSDAGNNFSPQVQLRWQPSSSLTLRTTASRGFRAPSLPEISNASSLSFEGATDPLDPLGRPFESVGALTKANPNLKPETSKNFDFGIVISPSANFNLSLDYYRISVDHVIASENTANNIINDPASYPGQIVRTPGGFVAYVVIPYENKYQVVTSGLDFEAHGVFHLNEGARFRLDAVGTYVGQFNVFNGSTWTDYVGTNGWLWDSPIGGGGSVPHLRGSVTGAWENAGWVAQGTVNYIDHYQNYCYVYGICGAGSADVPSNMTLDLYGEYRGLPHWKFSASILNVFNVQPPWDWFQFAYGGTNTPFDSSLYDARGRVYELRVAYRF